MEMKGGKQSDVSRATGATRSEAETGTRQSEVAAGNPTATLPERQPPPDMYAHSGQLRCTIAPTSSMQGCPSCDKRAVG